MDAENLATVFAPAFFNSDAKDLQKMLQVLQGQTQFVLILLNHMKFPPIGSPDFWEIGGRKEDWLVKARKEEEKRRSYSLTEIERQQDLKSKQRKDADRKDIETTVTNKRRLTLQIQNLGIAQGLIDPPSTNNGFSTNTVPTITLPSPPSTPPYYGLGGGEMRRAFDAENFLSYRTVRDDSWKRIGATRESPREHGLSPQWAHSTRPTGRFHLHLISSALDNLSLHRGEGVP